jgi:uncharacterized membrane protein
MQASVPVTTRLALAVARFCVAAWIGAAILFVIVGVREVTTPEFSSEVKDRLVLLRFPAYYCCGVVLLGVALVAMVIASIRHASSGIRFVTILLLIAGGLMAADYMWIYSPLATMVTPPGQPRTSAFITLHHQSMYINTAHLAMCLCAALGLFITEPKAESDSLAV